MQDAPVLLIVLAVLVWLFLASAFSRQGVWLLLLWIPIQGWIQLNVFDDARSTVLLYEYQLIGLYGIFVIRALSRPAEYRVPKAVWFAVPFIIWSLLLVPRSISAVGFVITTIGLRTYLLPLPLVWIGYHTFRSRKELETLGVVLMLESALVGMVAAAQYAGLDSLGGAIREVPTGFSTTSGILRPPGTFSSPGHLGMFILCMIPLGIGFLGMARAWSNRLPLVLGLLGTFVALIVNTQRATMVLLVVMIPAIVIVARQLKALRIVVLACFLGFAGWMAGTQVVGEAFATRVSSISDDLRIDLIETPSARMADALRTPVAGGGLGIASPGAVRLETPFGTKQNRLFVGPNSAESFMAALVYETGVPGLLFFYLYIGALLVFGARAVRLCRGTESALIAASIFCYEIAICIQSWTYDPLHYPPSRIFFWFWAGVLLSLPRLEAGTLSRARTAVSRASASAARRLGRSAAMPARGGSPREAVLGRTPQRW